MHGRIYITTPDQLLEHFLPKPTGDAKSIPNLFTGVPKFNRESEMYTWINNRLNGSRCFPANIWVATPHKSDSNDDTTQAIDGGMYPKKHAPSLENGRNGEESRRVRWASLELSMECKLDAVSQDPFDETYPDNEPVSIERRAVLGQILSYAELVYKYQQRTCHYMVLFFSTSARIIRFDRSGIVATEKMPYSTHGQELSTFLVRYARLGLTNKGHDPTAVRILPEDQLYKDALAHAQAVVEEHPDDYAAKAFHDTLVNPEVSWKMKVYDEATDEYHWFLVGKPHFDAGGVAGRATRGYIALPLTKDDRRGLEVNKATSDFVYLKDAWRIDHVSLEKEGSVLEKLNKAKVQYVPTVLCHGDIPGQRTLSYEKWSTCVAEEPKDGCPLKAHRHYRMVVKEVGKPLAEFTTGLELLMAVYCCIIAHEEACKVGYIHRDVSAGNILLINIGGGWFGILNDWELAKRYPDDQSHAGQQLDRTGTWPYMSVHALMDHARVITIADDLESLLYVTIQFAIRFLPHNCADEAVGNLLYYYFDDYMEGTLGQSCGLTKFFAMKTGKIYLTAVQGNHERASIDKQGPTLKFYAPCLPDEPRATHPINGVISTLLSWFQAHYAKDDEETEDHAMSVRHNTKQPESVTNALKHLLQKRNESGQPLPPPALPVESCQSTQKPSLSKEDGAKSELVLTHAAMSELILRSMAESKWPADDKGPDKRPKLTYKPVAAKEPASATSAQTNSKKRPRDVANTSKAKRARSGL